MKCVKCGAEIEDGSRFCEVCGTPVSAPEGMSGSLPNGISSQNVSYGGLNTRVIRKWFKGRPIWPILLTVLGLLTVMAVVGIFLLIIGVIAWIVTWMGASEGDVQEVDQAWNYCAKLLEQRGMEKLNLVKEQVGLIDPIVVTGRGSSPDVTFARAKIKSKSRRWGIFGWISSVVSLFRKDGTELDPYEAYRIAGDNGLRSMLRQLSVYMFTDTQLLRYTGNIDISTGMIYAESTDEVFYQDIEGIHFRQEVYKVAKKRLFVNRIAESVELYLGGCTLSSSISLDGGNSVIDQQFTAMRSLIRDKKNS